MNIANGNNRKRLNGIDIYNNWRNNIWSIFDAQWGDTFITTRNTKMNNGKWMKWYIVLPWLRSTE